jgi:hypothetical protein
MPTTTTTIKHPNGTTVSVTSVTPGDIDDGGAATRAGRPPAPAGTTALFAFGVVADVQYADLPDGSNFLGTVRRYYRHALDALALAVQSWLHDGPGGKPVAFVAQLGDLIDGKNADHGQTAAAAAAVHGVLSRLGDSIPIQSAIGNHEVMNWPRSRLCAPACCRAEAAAAAATTILCGAHLHELAQPAAADDADEVDQHASAQKEGSRADAQQRGRGYRAWPYIYICCWPLHRAVTCFVRTGHSN